jgi:hypothetical protein
MVTRIVETSSCTLKAEVVDNDDLALDFAEVCSLVRSVNLENRGTFQNTGVHISHFQAGKVFITAKDVGFM